MFPDFSPTECEKTAVKANVGEELRILCNLATPCFNHIYIWSLIYKNGTRQQFNESSNGLIITENITAVMDVGGEEYQCQCEGVEACQTFTIFGILVILYAYTMLLPCVVCVPYTICCYGNIIIIVMYIPLQS